MVTIVVATLRVEEEKREQEAANAENGGNSSLITDVTTGVQ